MKPLVEFPDAEAAIVAYLDAAYAGTLSDRKPDTISTGSPQTKLDPDAEWLQVELDGSFTEDYPATERATIRCNYWTAPGRRSNVKAGAALAFGLLGVHPGDVAVFGTVPLVGRSQVITDPATKNLMCWFTFRVNLRPSPVSA